MILPALSFGVYSVLIFVRLLSVNAALAVIALILAWRVGRHYKALTASKPAPAAA